MKLKTALLATALAASLLPAAAFAGTKVYSGSGFWSNFAGNDESGKYVCGMFASTGDQGVFVKYWPDGDHMSMQIFKKSWNIPSGTNVSVKLGFDNNEFWGSSDTAKGNTTKDGKMSDVEVAITPDTTENFLENFSHADKMWLSFPKGDEGNWVVPMKGSRFVAKKFADCVIASKPTQPFGHQATQPFGKSQPQQTTTSPSSPKQTTQPFGAEKPQPSFGKV